MLKKKSKMFNKNNQKKDILVVDDISSNLDLLGNILQLNGYGTRFATNGLEAIEEINKKHPDLIFLDISMPEMDGYELCKILKSSEETKDIPIIFLTAYSNTQHLLKAFQVGGQDYVTKPFNPEELLTRANTHIELKEKKAEIELYNHQLLKLNEELLRLNEILHQQKKVIEEKNNDLTSSLDYAKLIQTSLLTSAYQLEDYFDSSFIINKAKDIISGDFYFFHKLQAKNQAILIVADCTGHGVPGALLSVLGTSLVNKIIVSDNCFDPKEILYELDVAFINFLKSRENQAVSNDGMDIGICLFDFDTNELTFAGARRPIYKISKGTLEQFRGSIHPIGGYLQTSKDFKNYKMKFTKGDIIYLFSDGYADQFGGEDSKKLGTKRFKELLLQVHLLPLEKQKDNLLLFLDQWKGENEQIDDILFMGLQL